MKCQKLLLILLFIPTALSQEPVTVAQCRAKLEAWVPMFKAVYDAPECQGDGTVACAFAVPIKNLTSGQLTAIVAEADGCAKLDAGGDRYSYPASCDTSRKYSCHSHCILSERNKPVSRLCRMGIQTH